MSQRRILIINNLHTFNPKLAKKLTNSPYIDLGQGLLSLIGIFTQLMLTLKINFNF